MSSIDASALRLRVIAYDSDRLGMGGKLATHIPPKFDRALASVIPLSPTIGHLFLVIFCHQEEVLVGGRLEEHERKKGLWKSAVHFLPLRHHHATIRFLWEGAFQGRGDSL